MFIDFIVGMFAGFNPIEALLVAITCRPNKTKNIDKEK